MPGAAIGFVETRGLIGVIEAADAAAKAADVDLLGFEQIGGGLVSVRFGGDVGSVQAAVQAAVEAARRVGEVISHHVIPAPHQDIAGLLRTRPAAPGPPVGAPSDPAPGPSPTQTDLQHTAVARLRHMVRQSPEALLKGREVSRSTKEQLIAELRRLGLG